MTTIVTPQWQPKVVTLPALRKTLLKYTRGWSWAEDAIQDLWKLGAPAPDASFCPLEPPCPMLKCTHVKRILLPTQFSKWWEEVNQRMNYELRPELIHGKVKEV